MLDIAAQAVHHALAPDSRLELGSLVDKVSVGQEEEADSLPEEAPVRTAQGEVDGGGTTPRVADMVSPALAPEVLGALVVELGVEDMAVRVPAVDSLMARVPGASNKEALLQEADDNSTVQYVGQDELAVDE